MPISTHLIANWLFRGNAFVKLAIAVNVSGPVLYPATCLDPPPIDAGMNGAWKIVVGCYPNQMHAAAIVSRTDTLRIANMHVDANQPANRYRVYRKDGDVWIEIQEAGVDASGRAPSIALHGPARRDQDNLILSGSRTETSSANEAEAAARQSSASGAKALNYRLMRCDAQLTRLPDAGQSPFGSPQRL